MKMNRFGTFDEDDFKRAPTVRGRGGDSLGGLASPRLAAAAAAAADPPSAVDWVAAGAVSAVGDEAACGGACWAFAASSAIESARVIETGAPLAELSTQQLVDCVYPRCDHTRAHT